LCWRGNPAWSQPWARSENATLMRERPSMRSRSSRKEQGFSRTIRHCDTIMRTR
jgi:hypothetical protein